MTQPTLDGSEADTVAAGRRWRVLAVCSVAVFMSFLDVTIVNIAFPSLREEFAASSLSTLSWVINGYSIVLAAALVPVAGWPTGWAGAGFF